MSQKHAAAIQSVANVTRACVLTSDLYMYFENPIIIRIASSLNLSLTNTAKMMNSGTNNLYGKLQYKCIIS